METTKLEESSKQSYYKRVSGNQSLFGTSSKCYCSLLKRKLNEKKIPAIISYNNFISNLKEKSELFNKHFSKKCSLIQSKSTITIVFTPRSRNLFSSFQFTADDIKSKINYIPTRPLVMV